MITRRGILGLPVLWACAAATASARAEAPPLRVVASFSILADLLRNVGGDRIQVETLVGPDTDAHVFEPRPGDARNLAQAEFVLVNGLGFEGWMDRLIRASGTKANAVVASTGVSPRMFGNQPIRTLGRTLRTQRATCATSPPRSRPHAPRLQASGKPMPMPTSRGWPNSIFGSGRASTPYPVVGGG